MTRTIFLRLFHTLLLYLGLSMYCLSQSDDYTIEYDVVLDDVFRATTSMGDSPPGIVSRTLFVSELVDGRSDDRILVRRVIHHLFSVTTRDPLLVDKLCEYHSPWSAAFISYVVNPDNIHVAQGGIFPNALLHTRYVRDVLSMTTKWRKKNQPPTSYYIPETHILIDDGPMIGDILVRNRSGSTNSYYDVVESPAHGVIITNVDTVTEGDIVVSIVGGNESNTVRRSKIKWSQVINDILITTGDSLSFYNRGRYFSVLRHPAHYKK